MERGSQIENIAAAVIIAFLAVASFQIVRPFLPAVLWAIIYAVSSWPLFTQDTIESTLTMAPPPLARRIGANALLVRSIPKKLVSSWRRATSSLSDARNPP